MGHLSILKKKNLNNDVLEILKKFDDMYVGSNFFLYDTIPVPCVRNFPLSSPTRLVLHVTLCTRYV